MNRSIFVAAVAFSLGLLSLDASATNNGSGDYVTQVFVCDSNHILIDTKNEGWVFIDSSDVGGTTVAGWMLATALELLSTGKQIGSFYEPTGTVVSTGCGTSAAEITTLAASNTP